MATLNQIAANKANAQRSTGPRTDAGKAKSCLNHLSHGFASSTAKLIDGENPEELKALLADLIGEYQPATPTEQILVEKMAQNQWISLRTFRVQSDAFTIDKGRIDATFDVSPDLALLIRYRNSAENAFHKAHNELVKTQKERKNSEIGFESQSAGEAAHAEPKTAPITWHQTVVPAPPFPADREILAEAFAITKNAA